MSSMLAQEQSNLLQAIAGQGGSSFNLRGLQVYQANRAVLAERTLAGTYPVVAQLIGVESFEPLARHFWRQHPPLRGDMGQWGAQLPEFLAAAPQLADEPFLADVARIEWALHRAASAPDAVLDAASFALLSGDAAQPVSLALSQGTFTFASAYPVASIINAHLAGQPTLDQAADLLRQSQREHALVWRHGFKPKVRSTSPAEYGLINALKTSASLEAALDHVSSIEPTFDFNSWLGQAVQTGLVIGAIVCKL
jgi:Putative DNA-binding domain